MDRIDLRSDTVTWPTPAMREAMASAAVGDDVYGEDPTVNELEAVAARMFGKAAALFVPSGTMANLIGVLCHCGRGDEAIMGDRAHTFTSEVGSIAAFGGVQPRTLPVQPDGTFAMADLRGALRDPQNVHHPTSKLILLENAQCGVGGMPLSAAYTAEVAGFAAEHGLKLHIDGSRIFNAAAALGCQVADLAAPADSISFCLSKGLGAPVGAMLVGDEALIHQARRIRKALGGGMRQAGVLAAAGLVALRETACRVQDDHVTARRLAEGLAALPGVVLDPERVKINMVVFDLADDVPFDAYEITERMKARNIWLGPRSARGFRLVTHLWVTPEDIDDVIAAFEELLA